jgi:hypothetical protein
MSRALSLVVMTVAICAWATTAVSEPVDLETLEKLTNKFEFSVKFGSVEEGKLRFIYTDHLNHIHVYRLEDQRFEPDWELTTLGSRVTSMYVTELFGDGRAMLVFSTFGGRILVYDMDGYDLVWENLQDPFQMIDYLVSANLDSDPQQELIFIAEEKLIIYDSLNRNFEWVSTFPVVAQMIRLGNLDDDPQQEIILNTGTIIDSKFFNIEFEWDRPFGARIELFDMNGDGIPEIFGESPDMTLKIFDRYAERLIW